MVNFSEEIEEHQLNKMLINNTEFDRIDKINEIFYWILRGEMRGIFPSEDLLKDSLCKS